MPDVVMDSCCTCGGGPPDVSQYRSVSAGKPFANFGETQYAVRGGKSWPGDGQAAIDAQTAVVVSEHRAGWSGAGFTGAEDIRGQTHYLTVKEEIRGTPRDGHASDSSYLYVLQTYDKDTGAKIYEERGGTDKTGTSYFYSWRLSDLGVVTESGTLFDPWLWQPIVDVIEVGYGLQEDGTPDPDGVLHFSMQLDVSQTLVIHTFNYDGGTDPTSAIHVTRTRTLSDPYTLVQCVSDSDGMLGDVNLANLGQIYEIDGVNRAINWQENIAVVWQPQEEGGVIKHRYLTSGGPFGAAALAGHIGSQPVGFSGGGVTISRKFLYKAAVNPPHDLRATQATPSHISTAPIGSPDNGEDWIWPTAIEHCDAGIFPAGANVVIGPGIFFTYGYAYPSVC